MTALLAVALAGGTLLIFSALVNKPLADTFRSVINGQASTLADVTTSSGTDSTQQQRPTYPALHTF